MKKSLLALAALTAFAGAATAQSSVTLSGIVKGGFASTKYSNGATGNGTGAALADGSSRFIISGVEDLGGGLSAVFQADTRWRLDDNGGAVGSAAPTSGVASQLATGNTWLGLRGGFGQFRIGKFDTHYCLGSDDHGGMATALTASSCALLGYVNGAGAAQAIANASRSTNIIRYDMPAIVGLTGNVSYSTSFQSSEGALGADKGKAWNVGLNYVIGPIGVGVSQWRATNEARSADQRGLTGAVKLDFGMFSAGLTYDKSSLKPNPGNRAERSVFSVPLTATFGASKVIATFSKAGKVDVDGVTVANSGSKLMSVGYQYSLSKRTSLGASLAVLNNNAAAAYGLYTQNALVGHQAPVAGQDQRQLYLGLRHTF